MELSIGITNKNSKNILVGLIYRHPGTSIPEFGKQLSEY